MNSGLKAQEFLVADNKHIVPTERGLVLHGVLERADPALVDPGVTAQMERWLDDVLVGRQDMMSAIDAVCEQASRIIGRLTERGAAHAIPTIPAAASMPDRSLQKSSSRSTSPARTKVATFRGDRQPPLDADKGNPPAKGAAVRQRCPTASSIADGSGEPERFQSKPRGRASKARSSPTKSTGGRFQRSETTSAETGVSGETPLRIPYGNKEAAQAMGARYRAGGWYAPADVSLTGFRERGWL